MDFILKNGTIVDGLGTDPYKADIRISGDRIDWIGEGPRQDALEIDVEGQVVAPGFVDFHAHTDMTALANPEVESKITQGVTLEVNGNCGYSDAPLLSEQSRERARRSFERMGVELTWSGMGEMLDTLENRGIGLNFCTFVGHGNLRREAVGLENRPASKDEIRSMQNMARQAVEEGAIGVSTGLIYPPSSFADTDELVDIMRPIGKDGAIYSTHMRSESVRLLESVEEAIAVGERSESPVQISHLKACGQSNYGKTITALTMIEKARGRGVDVTADQYPYLATSTGLSTVLPGWVHSGGASAMHERMADPLTREKIRNEVARSFEGGYWKDSGGTDTILISSVGKEDNRWMEGLNMTQVAQQMGKHPVDAVLDLLVDEDFGVGMVHFCISDEDVEAVMRTPHTLFGSDATARSLSGPMSKGHPHPRAFGTFPRILAHYVREKRVLSLPEAVRKMTSLAADRLGLTDRGRLRPQCFADIVVFDPQGVQDAASFTQPKQNSVGIRHVIVNGRFAMRDGAITGELPGRVIRGGG